MLLSMTGFGEARFSGDQHKVTVEVRAVNNRYLKLNVKCPDLTPDLENQIEKTVRDYVTRGSLTLTIRLKREQQESNYVLNTAAISNYWRDLHKLAETIHLATPQNLGDLLTLPGVVQEGERDPEQTVSSWSLIEPVLREAMKELQSFRDTEGQSMQKDLTELSNQIRTDAAAIAAQAPSVVTDYRNRLLDRVKELLKDTDVSVSPSDLIREVSIFADRCDINEELTRLRSHLDQFDTIMRQEQSPGRKLEFLGQEMFREVNTLGAKANDVGISHSVVQMKATIEKIREILQNVE